MGKRASDIEKERREDVCAAIVACILGARFNRRDMGGAQIHDFDLEFPDGGIEALEVCSFTDPIVREQWSALSRLDEEAPSLTGVWTISVGRGDRVKGLLARVEPLLAVLEQHQETRFVFEEHYAPSTTVHTEVAAAWRGLINLGIRDALRAPCPSDLSPRIIIAAGVGGAGTSDLINQAVESVASGEDNQRKLERAAGSRRRHIVIPIDTTTGVVWSLAAEGPPAQPPRLPSTVDVAWVVGAGSRALYVEPPDSWQMTEIDEATWDHPDRWRLPTESRA